jgi:hypothetical protein
VAQGFEVVPTPPLPFARLLAEAINKVPPFEHGDKGFRDAVIFETVAGDASGRHPGGYVLIVSNENWSPEVLQRLRAQGVDGEVVKLHEAPTRLKALLQATIVAEIGRREKVATEFLERNRPLIEEAMKMARVRLEPSPFHPLGDEDDMPKYGEIRYVESYRIGEITSAYPGLGDTEELRAQGRYPILFSVVVYLDVLVEEPTLARVMSHGSIVALENVTRIKRLEDEVASEPLTTFSERTLRRSVTIEATVALEGADHENYRDLRITNASAF